MIAEWLLKKAKGIERDPDFIVGEKSDPYLRRWWIIPRNKYFNIYLHNMLRDDSDVLHDHPWWSLSFVLSDGLVENYVSVPPNGERKQRTIKQGTFVWRSSIFAHQLVVVKPAWTIFMTGPVIREWGFWCPRGWKHWKDYAQVKDGVSVADKGCGES